MNLSFGRLAFKLLVWIFLQLVPGYTVQRRLEHIWVLGLAADLSLLPRFSWACSVPVCADLVIVPNSGGLSVADVAWVPCIMCWVHQKRLCREGLEVPGFKLVLIIRAAEERLRTERKALWAHVYVVLHLSTFTTWGKHLHRVFIIHDGKKFIHWQNPLQRFCLQELLSSL